MKRTKRFRSAAFFAMLAAGAATAIAQFDNGSGTSVTTTTVTGVTGTIAQLNYGTSGEVEGFLVGTNTLLSFSQNICGGIGTLGAVGNSITYSGTAVTTTAGFESVRVTSFTNSTTKAAYTAATTPAATAYGPTSGAVKQLNYASDGSIDGFLFTPSGSTTAIFVSTGSRASATLKPVLTVGATVSVTGTTSPAMSACTATATLTTVDASSLIIAGQTIVIAGGGAGSGYGGGPGGHR